VYFDVFCSVASISISFQFMCTMYLQIRLNIFPSTLFLGSGNYVATFNIRPRFNPTWNKGQKITVLHDLISWKLVVKLKVFHLNNNVYCQKFLKNKFLSEPHICWIKSFTDNSTFKFSQVFYYTHTHTHTHSNVQSLAKWNRPLCSTIFLNESHTPLDVFIYVKIYLYI
jgi:hypothetical protein